MWKRPSPPTDLGFLCQFWFHLQEPATYFHYSPPVAASTKLIPFLFHISIHNCDPEHLFSGPTLSFYRAVIVQQERTHYEHPSKLQSGSGNWGSSGLPEVLSSPTFGSRTL